MLHKRIKYLSQSVPFSSSNKFSIFIFFFLSAIPSWDFSPHVEFYVHPERFKNLTQQPETSGSCGPSSASVNLTKILQRCVCPEVRAGGSRKAVQQCPSLPNSREGSLYSARDLSHRMPTVLWSMLSHSMCKMVKQALFTLNYTTGLLPENVSFENGRICPFREEAYVWNMAGDTFLQPGRHKVITNPHSAGGVFWLGQQQNSSLPRI